MEENIKWFLDQRIERVIDSLRKRKMLGIYIENKNDLIPKLKEFLIEGSTIGVGDSLTLQSLGVFELLNNGNYKYLNKYMKNITSKEKKDIYIKNFSSDTFITGTNAITEEGEIFNIDGNGSRVAPIIYGPKQVILIVGINKIVKNMDEAYNRVRQYSAPIDAKRLGKNTPCTLKGKCYNCKSDDRICNDFVTISGQFIKDRIKVIIVNENLGY